MKTLAPIFLALALLLSGCVSPAGQGSRFLPWNWFHPDANAAVAKANAQAEAAKKEAIDKAHEETVKAGVALEYAPPSPPVEFAKRTLGNGNGLLAQVAALSAEREILTRKLVVDLFSGGPDAVEAANRQQSQAEKAIVTTSRRIEATDDRVTKANDGLLAANLSNSTDAAKYRRLWFWIWVIVGGWALLQILSGLSRFWPTLAPVARVAGFLSAPAVQAGYERVTKAVSTVIADARKKSKETAETLREHLDGPMDDSDKRLIRAKVKKAEEKAEA